MDGAERFKRVGFFFVLSSETNKKKCSYHDLASTKREEKTHKRTNGRGEGGERAPAQLL